MGIEMQQVSARLAGIASALLLLAIPLLAADPPKKEELAKPAKKAPETTAKVTVRDVNLYVMSSYGNSLNHRDLFKSTLPGFIGPRRATAERKVLNNPSPAGLITFEGDATDNVDVLLEFTNGRFFGNWPPCPQKSKRLLWVKSKLTKEPGDVVSTLPENHWMTFLRNVATGCGSNRAAAARRFVLYDAELPLPAPVKVTLIEGGHGLANTAKYPLHDVTVYKPERDKWLVGSVPLLEAPPKKEEKPDEKKDKDKKKPDPEAVFDKEKDAKDKPAEGNPRRDAGGRKRTRRRRRTTRQGESGRSEKEAATRCCRSSCRPGSRQPHAAAGRGSCTRIGSRWQADPPADGKTAEARRSRTTPRSSTSRPQKSRRIRTRSSPRGRRD